VRVAHERARLRARATDRDLAAAAGVDDLAVEPVTRRRQPAVAAALHTARAWRQNSRAVAAGAMLTSTTPGFRRDGEPVIAAELERRRLRGRIDRDARATARDVVAPADAEREPRLFLFGKLSADHARDRRAGHRVRERDRHGMRARQLVVALGSLTHGGPTSRPA